MGGNNISFDFNTFTSGGYSYSWLSEKITNINQTVVEHPDMHSIMEIIRSLSFISIIMLAAALVMALFGKKLLPLIKVVTCFAVGFALGVGFINEKLVDIIDLPAWISGIIFGILFVILYRLIYVIFYIAFPVYAGYAVGFWALGDMLASLGDLKAYVFVGIGVVLLIIALIRRKYIEMLGTAALGGWIAANLLVAEGGFLNGVAFLVDYSWILFAAIALIGFAIQVKTRRKY